MLFPKKKKKKKNLSMQESGISFSERIKITWFCFQKKVRRKKRGKFLMCARNGAQIGATGRSWALVDSGWIQVKL